MNALTRRSATAHLASLLLLAATLLAHEGLAAETDGEWRITLLKPRDCGGCSFLEESLKRRGAVQRTTLSDGNSEVSATIERRVGAEVNAEEWQELRRLPYFDERLWRQRATEQIPQVLLKRDGHVVAAGAINDSADLHDARFPADLTAPLDGNDPQRVRAAFAGVWQDIFIGGWNLNWYYRLARNPALGSGQRFADWITKRPRQKAPALGKANVLLASTGNGASDNPIFNAIRSEEIEGVLTRELGVSTSSIHVRYGPGAARGNNAVEGTVNGLRFIRRDLPRAEAFTIDSLAAFFEGVRAQQPAHNLIVLIGHGGPEGAPLWGEAAPLGPEEMRWLHAHGKADDVLVSGNCYGGVLAEAVDCGFFGARPDVVATGCQADSLEVAQSKDYLHVYFEAFTADKRPLADTNHDGKVSFDEAHWYATRFGDERNVTYSTVDALADAWLKAHPDALPEDISLSDLQKLGASADTAEREALGTLTRGLVGSHRFPLKDVADQAARYSAAPAGPRPMLAQLARRWVYLSRAGSDPALLAARSCGARSPDSFLRP